MDNKHNNKSAPSEKQASNSPLYNRTSSKIFIESLRPVTYAAEHKVYKVVEAAYPAEVALLKNPLKVVEHVAEAAISNMPKEFTPPKNLLQNVVNTPNEFQESAVPASQENFETTGNNPLYVADSRQLVDSAFQNAASNTFESIQEEAARGITGTEDFLAPTEAGATDWLAAIEGQPNREDINA